MQSSVPPLGHPQRSLNTEVPSAVLFPRNSAKAAIPIKAIPTHNRNGKAAWRRTTPSNTVRTGTIKYCETYRRASICNTSTTTKPAISKSSATAPGEKDSTTAPPEILRANSITASPASPPRNISATAHSIAIPLAVLRHVTQATATAHGGTSNPTYAATPIRNVTGNISSEPPRPTSPGQNSTEPSLQTPLITATIIGTKQVAAATFTGRAAAPPTTTPNELKANKPAPTADNCNTSRTRGTRPPPNNRNCTRAHSPNPASPHLRRQRKHQARVRPRLTDNPPTGRDDAKHNEQCPTPRTPHRLPQFSFSLRSTLVALAHSKPAVCSSPQTPKPRTRRGFSINLCSND